ncbi:hypothetical protein PO609_07440, partial [Enterobacter cloacae]|uniref:hypothetical protein n=1 Tax=Enterobacter cloacae TaxID=550 RepID=UPI002FF7C2BF
SVRHIFKPISYLEIQLLSGVSGGYIRVLEKCIKVSYLNQSVEVISFFSKKCHSQLGLLILGQKIRYSIHAWQSCATMAAM